MNIIFLPTVQHTGTWFCANFLLRHSAIPSARDLHTLKDGFIDYGRAVIMAHLAGEECDPDILAEKGVYHTDIEKHWPREIISELCGPYPTFSTIRDPLASLVSRQVRIPDHRHFYLIDGFLSLARIWEQHRFPLVSVDRYNDKCFSERRKLLQEILAYVGLPEEAYVKLWAATWPVINPNREPEGTLHSALQQGDLSTLRGAIPDEYDYLKSHEATLRPFLEEQGYRDLLWWR